MNKMKNQTEEGFIEKFAYTGAHALKKVGTFILKTFDFLCEHMPWILASTLTAVFFIAVPAVLAMSSLVFFINLGITLGPPWNYLIYTSFWTLFFTLTAIAAAFDHTKAGK